MGTIIERPRADGSIAYKAEIVIRKDGKRRKFSQTFDREVAAKRWIKNKEAELRKPGGIERQDASRKTLGHAIETYLSTNPLIGRTKAQVLNTILQHPISDRPADRIASHHIVAYAEDLLETRKPQTVNNYLYHLSSIFQVAGPAWGIPLEPEEMRLAMKTAKRLNLIGRSSRRDRRPTIDEMDRIMTHFEQSYLRGRSNPMHVIVAFAMFSTRRQEEISRIFRKDYDPISKRILIRDMKHPGQKQGNDVWCDLPDVACRIIDKHGDDPRLFPYSTDAICASFTRACKFLDIKDLRFHDLRHEGISRLFEMGLSIPQVAGYSGHRSWSSLQRYSHIRVTGDRWEDWHWIEKIT